MREEEEVEAKIEECMDRTNETGGANAAALHIRDALEWVMENTDDLEI